MGITLNNGRLLILYTLLIYLFDDNGYNTYNNLKQAFNDIIKAVSFISKIKTFFKPE